MRDAQPVHVVDPIDNAALSEVRGGIGDSISQWQTMNSDPELNVVKTDMDCINKATKGFDDEVAKGMSFRTAKMKKTILDAHGPMMAGLLKCVGDYYARQGQTPQK